ncbi:MAG: IclR family transcriptional regulator, partial [Pseudomonadota bacterium]
QVAMPPLIELSRGIGETVNLARPSGGDIVYVARIPTQRTHFAATFVGRRAPALNTSSGRAMLAARPEAEIDEAVATWPLKRYTPQTTLDRAEIRAQIREAQERGYAFSQHELIRNEIGVAAAILDVEGAPVAAVHCSVSALAWTPGRVSQELAPRLLQTINALSPASSDGTLRG